MKSESFKRLLSAIKDPAIPWKLDGPFGRVRRPGDDWHLWTINGFWFYCLVYRGIGPDLYPDEINFSFWQRVRAHRPIQKLLKRLKETGLDT